MPLPLVERSPKEIARKIKRQVESMKDVKGCHQVDVRMTGKRFEVNMHLSLDRNLKFEEVHGIASNIEREVQRTLPHARVTIQTEPIGDNSQGLGRVVKEIAESVPGSRGVHDIHIQKIAGKLCVDLHLEVSANMTVKQAHDVSDQIENKLRSAKLNISEITIHVESASDMITRELKGNGTELKWYVEHAVKRFPEIKAIHGVRIRRVGDKKHLVLSCHFDPGITVEHAHEVSDKLENIIKGAYPDVERIDVHEEPA